MKNITDDLKLQKLTMFRVTILPMPRDFLYLVIYVLS